MAFVAYEYPFEVRLSCTRWGKHGLVCKGWNRLKPGARAAAFDSFGLFLCTSPGPKDRAVFGYFTSSRNKKSLKRYFQT